MSVQKIHEVHTDALPNICAGSGCFTWIARGKKLCDACAEKAELKRKRNTLHKQMSRARLKVKRELATKRTSRIEQQRKLAKGET